MKACLTHHYCDCTAQRLTDLETTLAAERRCNESLRTENKRLREALLSTRTIIGLLNSMVLSGEGHSSQSKERTQAALVEINEALKQ